MSALADANRAVGEAFYRALADGDFDALAALHSDDVVFNLLGSTPVSGRWEGKAECFGPLVADMVVGKLEPETIQFSREWRIMCADDTCVVGLMRGGGMGKNGLIKVHSSSGRSSRAIIALAKGSLEALSNPNGYPQYPFANRTQACAFA